MTERGRPAAGVSQDARRGLTMDEVVAAVDVGTQTVRAALIDRGGNIRDLASAALDLHIPGPGLAEQCPEDWWEITAATLSKLLARRRRVRIAAVGVGAQMHGLVPVDAGGHSLSARVGIWSDKRASGIVRRLRQEGAVDELTRVAGNLPLPAWSGIKAAWLREVDSHAYRRAHRLLVAKDFVNLQLTGRGRTDPTEASGSWLMDAATGDWSPRLMEALRVAPDKLPPIVPSDQVIGSVRRAAASRTGLLTGTPVVCGAGDMLCQLAATGMTHPGCSSEISGTAAILATYTELPGPPVRTMNLRTAGRGWARFGIVDAGGASLRWFADELCGTVDGDAAGSGTSRYDALSEGAAKVPPGARGLVFLPHLLGERTLGSAAARGVLVGLTPEHGRAHLFRAILEGICFDLRRYLDEIGVAGNRRALRVIGGGARNPLWNQIRSDVYGLPVQRLACDEGGLLGAALLAMVGAGWYADLAEAAAGAVAVSDRYEPQPEAVARYDRAYRTYLAVHDAQAHLWESWPAP